MNPVPPPRKAMPRERPKLGSCGHVHRRHSTGGPEGASEATAHRTPNLGTAAAVDAGSHIGGVHRTACGNGRRKLGGAGGEIFIPQSYRRGQEPRWTGMKRGRSWKESSRSYVFCMRSMASGGSCHRAYPTPASRLFWKRTVGFQHFGGGFKITAVRQSEKCGAEDSAGTSAGGDATFHRLPIAVRVPERVLHSGARQ